MSFLSQTAHAAIQVYQKASYKRFVKGLSELEALQKQKLQDTLSYLKPYLGSRADVAGYKEFHEKFPITSYHDYRELFSSERKTNNKTLPEVVRFQPTSGSTDNLKWIPYTQGLLKDFDAALGPWLYDFYSSYPEVLRGPHYWSLSWLPQDLRDEGVRLNDTELFPAWKKLLLKQTMAVMAPVDLAGSSESSLFATVAYLLDRDDLSFASVWSPTYWLTLLKILETHQKSLAHSLMEGEWQAYANELTMLECPHNPERGRELLSSTNAQELWPQLKALSCWTTSTSSAFAKDIENRFPKLKVIGKGLWATEGVVTIPFQGHYTLASQSHFFEFEDIESKEILPSWELRIGQKVSPILTTTGGLIRYKMQDVLEVSGFNRKTPCLNFLGRADGVDMVGEKTSSLRAQEVLSALSKFAPHQESYLFAVKAETNQHYCAVLSRQGNKTLAELSKELEELLSESFHYKLARELQQLGPAQVLVHEKAHEKYLQLHLNRGMVLGNIKTESLRLISEKELQENFL
ncbi:GH3 family domain-containing protein [Bdellovibrio sp. BCCA]|uniref:GH3 family domain-containing protein n=1 Tax=Bdellovibrio sp. BCCA TaxID=3136281 RepID=UPI0030F25475